ncbi:MAG: cupin domain-containing protein [Pseudanabaena sp.]|jgi:cupin 2 domain-containing protein|nr:cupin domain-containing protein [Pseudanabaena sp. M090S1SP2A07QC]MCA6507266.1 cupin domain-containing protein [Pseudanabaena sp. M172S2SP2A07QC]MCA6519100.1 cupin domain-containing protein [Pseudanabaena sp. M110S1SP2A07QC]MCA6520701.1 cupin domain-containing protein [Pseudanabaena sp. M051S1SP2A07QC]MCA6527444.1 cupin domain-containing protein [Pseudanabaena sp. M179S2SP2A07QC]MCA6528496.1 cupin domain-containing protein [Pseudanabaena sp. M125S2SP2A07QC]MCA6535454.1 cupin domain-contain
MPNIYELNLDVNQVEQFEAIEAGQNILIERIISTGQTTPVGQWYDQDADEWVVLLQGDAEIYFEEGPLVRLRAGDYLMISAHQKHRVEYTSIEPPCIWLAVHGQLRSL